MRSINRFHVLIIFIVFSVLLYFLLNKLFITPGGSTTPDNMGAQLANTLGDAFTALGVFSLTIIGIPIIGLLIFRIRRNKEVFNGFLYSLLYSVLVLVVIFLLLR